MMPSNSAVRILMPVSITCGNCWATKARASFKIWPRVLMKAGMPPVSNAVVSSSTQPLTIGMTVPANASVRPDAKSPFKLARPSWRVESCPVKVLDWASIAP